MNSIPQELSPFEIKCIIAKSLGYISKIGYMDQASNSKEQYWITPNKLKTSILPDWSTDIKIAWELLEEMCKSGQGLPNLCFKSGYIESDYGKTAWVFEFRLFSQGVYLHGVHEIVGVGETAPIAICDAYLKWKAKNV